MRNKVMRVLAGLLCAIAIVTNAIPVNAATNACKAHVTVRDGNAIIGYNSIGNEKHECLWGAKYTCINCSAILIERDVVAKTTETHTFNGGTTDIGHKDGIHKYDIKCSLCNQVIRVEIVCDYERTGYHYRP